MKPSYYRVTFAIDAKTLERVDEYVERIRKERPGVEYTRSDAIREGLHTLLGTKDEAHG